MINPSKRLSCNCLASCRWRRVLLTVAVALAAYNAPALPMQATPQASLTTLSAPTSSLLSGASVAINIAVTGVNSTPVTPTGSFVIVVDGAVANSSLALSNGSASYNFVAGSTGPHAISANYSGDANYAASTGTITITVASKTFAVSATAVTVSAGSAGTSTVTVTPENGYTGTVDFTVGSNSQITIPCFSAPSAAVTGTAPVTVTVTINTSNSGCSNAALQRDRKDRFFAASTSAGSTPQMPQSPSRNLWIVLGLATVFLAGAVRLLLGQGKLATRCAVGLVVLGTLVISGCGSSGSSIKPGSYSVTITGLDKTANIAASTTVAFTVN